MMVEEARVLFNSYTRYREEPSSQEWSEVRQQLITFANNFLRSDQIDESIFDRRFMPSPMSRPDRDNPSEFIRTFFADSDEGRLTSRMVIGEALVIFLDYITSKDLDLATVQGEISFSQLGRIVPQQQIAPAKFEIREQKIFVVKEGSDLPSEDEQNVASALDFLTNAGEKLIENLESSNCDRRLLDSARELHKQIVDHDNVVKIGLCNLAFGEMGREFHCELPDAVNGMISSYCSAASLYVGQFPEWEQFTQNAALVELDADEITEVQETASRIVDVLQGNSDLADPAVPQTIALISELMSDPGKSSKRAVFAMIRTVENLVSSILHFGIKFSSKTAEKTIELGSGVSAKVFVGLLSVALVGASGIGGAAMTAGSPWVRQAAEIVQKQISSLAD